MPTVVLVTGCSEGGIGYQLCLAFQEFGAVVYGSARRLESVASLHEHGVQTIQLDVCDHASIQAAVKHVIDKEGRIDILVNNAGLAVPAPLAEVDISKARTVMDTNVWGLLAVTQAVIPHMVEQNSGKIVNIGSVAGITSTPWNGVYCASKAAVHSLTDALRMEMKPFGVDVMLIAPGAIKSNIGENSKQNVDTSGLKIFKMFEGAIVKRAEASQGPKATPTEDFAKRVVQQVLKSPLPPFFSYGQLSSLMRLLPWCPYWVREWLMMKGFGLMDPEALKKIEGNKDEPEEEKKEEEKKQE